MERKEIVKIIRPLPREQICWFASRCALRALPLLARQEQGFSWWGKEADRHLISVFRALNASLFIAAWGDVPGRNKKEVTVTATYSTYAAYAAAAAYAADAADATDAAYAAAYSAYAAYAAYTAAAASFTAAVKTDLRFLQDSMPTTPLPWPDLWPQRQPKGWEGWLASLESGLHRLGLGYWVEEFAAWRSGRFNLDRMERCLLMPESIIASGVQAILDYLQAEILVNLAEARVVFLGEGRAGKTSLIRCLHDEDLRPDERPTPRVEIRRRREPIGGQEPMVHYWDFGGQVIMHATHQFFLREKCVYVIVLDSQRNDFLEYWLDHVRFFGKGAPTLIVCSKIDQGLQEETIETSFDIDKIREMYPFVVPEVHFLSSLTKEGVPEFQAALRTQIMQNLIFTKDTPEPLFKVKEVLLAENRDYIARKRFDAICADAGLGEEKASVALTVLDCLGVAIHFPQLLSHTDVVLNPEWITRAIYYIIWNSKRCGGLGSLSVAMVQNLFAKVRDGVKTEGDVPPEVPEDKYAFLLELMVAFKLAFHLANRPGELCAPMLAPVKEPQHGVQEQGSHHFSFHFSFLPPGLFYRFITESGAELDGENLWRQGAVLAQGKNRVLIKCDPYSKTISLFGEGEHSGEYLFELRRRLSRLIGSSFSELPYDVKFATQKGEVFDWRDLVLRYQDQGVSGVVYGNEGLRYTVDQILEKFLGESFPKILQDEIRDYLERKGVRMDIRQEQHNHQQVTQSQTSNQNNTQSLKLVLSFIPEVKSGLVELEQQIKRIELSGSNALSESKKPLDQLKMEIGFVREGLDELQNIKENGSGADAKPVLKRIKENWDCLAELAKQIYYVEGVRGKISPILEAVTPMIGKALLELTKLPLDSF